MAVQGMLALFVALNESEGLLSFCYPAVGSQRELAPMANKRQQQPAMSETPFCGAKARYRKN